jgi:cobalt/nickel transport system permease protein
MHIPDGFVSPVISVTTGVLSAGAFGGSVARANKVLDSARVPMLGVTAAFVFAAQMLNFPVAAGTSGHFLGALLAAILLGPAAGMIVITVVLLLQALLFADGGITALGANVFNMGVIGGWLAWGVFRVLRGALPKTRTGFLFGAGVAAWLSVVLSAVVAAIELAASGTAPMKLVLPAMTGVHALIGIGEALITVAALSAVLTARPDMVAAWPSLPQTFERTDVQEPRPEEKEEEQQR